MAGNPNCLASSLSAERAAYVLLCFFPDLRANPPSELVSLLSPESVLTEPHLLDDLAATMLGDFAGSRGGQEGGLEGERITPL